MFVKLAVLAVSVVAFASAVYNGPLAGGLPAAQFPAGVSPQACPNYPNCNNPALAANPSAPVAYGGYNAAPQYNAPAPQYNPQYNPAPVPQYHGNQGVQSALDRGEYTGDGDYRGEGLAESGAYGNQQHAGAYNTGAYNTGAYNPAPQAYHNNGPPTGLGQIPAGVDASSCPNYPFCH